MADPSGILGEVTLPANAIPNGHGGWWVVAPPAVQTEPLGDGWVEIGFISEDGIGAPGKEE